MKKTKKEKEEEKHKERTTERKTLVGDEERPFALCYRSSGRGTRTTTNRWWRQKSELVNPRRGDRVTVAVAMAMAMAAVEAAVAAAADGGEGTMTSSTVREHLWISAVESLTSYHHRTTAEPRVQVESNGNGNATHNETGRIEEEVEKSPKIKGKRLSKDTWQSLPKKVGNKGDCGRPWRFY